MPPNLRSDLAFDQSELENKLAGLVIQAKVEPVAPPASPVATNNDNEVVTSDDWENVVDLEAAATETDLSDPDMKQQKVEYNPSSPAADHHNIKDYIRRQSTCLSSGHRYAALDEGRLSQATKDAGFYAFGIMAVEVWVLNEDSGQLERPNGGWWASEFLDYASPVLWESSEKDSVPTCIPGVGLAGVLWAENGGVVTEAMRQSRVISRDNSQLSLSRHKSVVSLPDLNRTQAQQIRWRDIKSLLEDPDTPKDTRFNAYMASGFGLAAGVPFQSFLSRGIVLYLARSTADMGQIDTVENRIFLDCSTHTIGAVIAGSQARRACLMRKQILRAEAFRKIQHGMDLQHHSNRKELRHQSSSLSYISVTLSHWKKHLKRRIRGWSHKCRGGDLQIPPPMTWDECFYTLLGCFVGLLILSTINELAKDISDDDLNLLIGPFGALMTLLYGLSSAPASQPRNVIWGQAVAGAVSMSFTYIPEDIMSTWMRRAVGPAFAITAMVKLGIPHPPAGAHSVIYASGLYGWKFYFLVVLSSIISVIPATMVNNLSQKRQYPTFWGYAPSSVMTRIKRMLHGEDEKKA